jgi:hypothetical protein
MFLAKGRENIARQNVRIEYKKIKPHIKYSCAKIPHIRNGLSMPRCLALPCASDNVTSFGCFSNKPQIHSREQHC